MKNSLLIIPGTFCAVYSIGIGIYIGLGPLAGKIYDGNFKDISLTEVAFSLIIPASIYTFVLAHKQSDAAYLLLNGLPLLGMRFA